MLAAEAMQSIAPLGIPDVVGPHSADCPGPSCTDPLEFKIAVPPAQWQATLAVALVFWIST